ncbi:hypothetical protein PG997_001464 [Apiospora hydei]|uniref:Uncharacterized protein n=1 Tax=Apiospora hydei TaxID=1337664 RepID=A0ABR1XDM8_9PEZI
MSSQPSFSARKTRIDSGILNPKDRSLSAAHRHVGYAEAGVEEAGVAEAGAAEEEEGTTDFKTQTQAPTANSTPSTRRSLSRPQFHVATTTAAQAVSSRTVSARTRTAGKGPVGGQEAAGLEKEEEGEEVEGAELHGGRRLGGG